MQITTNDVDANGDDDKDVWGKYRAFWRHHRVVQLVHKSKQKIRFVCVKGNVPVLNFSSETSITVGRNGSCERVNFFLSQLKH